MEPIAPPARSHGARLRTIMLAGLVAVLPLFLTVWIIKAMLGILDGILSPVVSAPIVLYLNGSGITDLPKGTRIPGVGLVATVIVILLAGLAVRNIVGRELVAGFERLLARLPVAGWFFSSFKELMGLFTKKKAFSRVALVEYPRDGAWAIAFVTGTTDELVARCLGGSCYTNVYVPTTPNPTSGILLMVPSERVHPMALTVEEGFKLVVSAGIVTGRQGGGTA